MMQPGDRVRLQWTGNKRGPKGLMNSCGTVLTMAKTCAVVQPDLYGPSYTITVNLSDIRKIQRDGARVYHKPESDWVHRLLQRGVPEWATEARTTGYLRVRGIASS